MAARGALDRAIGQRAQERLARDGDEDGPPESGAQRGDPLQYGDRRVGVAAQEESHARVDDQSLLGDAGRHELAQASVEEALDRIEDLLGGGPIARGPRPLEERVDDDRVGAGVGQPRPGLGIRKAPDVVDHRDPGVEGPREDPGLGRIDRQPQPFGGQGRYHGLETSDLILRGDEVGVGVARGGTQLEQIRPRRCLRPCMGDGGLGREIATSVGEGVLRDVHNRYDLRGKTHSVCLARRS